MAEREKLVPTYHTCIRLKELGWHKATLFTWDGQHLSSSYYNEKFPYFVTDSLGASGYRRAYAPTLSEILDELPEEVVIRRWRGEWSAVLPELWKSTDRAVEAAALLLILLIEKGVMNQGESN